MPDAKPTPAKTTPAKKVAKQYVSECKRCTFIDKTKKIGVRAVKKNLEGKSPISCTMCGSKEGMNWRPVAQKA